MSSQVFSQINTGGTPKVPFGSNSRYEYGIMPTNLPSGGTYGQSQDAASAYNTWKTTYVESCSGGRFRVKFDTPGETVSEGIAYGMLLSVYAADKALFDGLWAYYKQFRNGNGVMDWKINGCNGGVSGSGGATDAELDAAMALIIASEQWSSTTYRNDAITLIKTVKNTEMHTNGQTLNGDQWGNTNTCRNPSYQSPAYYKQYALVDTDNASFWGTTAINAASTLLLANRNSTSGLVSNWCDNNGNENTCGNTGSGANGYGADACRAPWRTAVDYLWHGNAACAASKDINTKLTAFVNGYEGQMKGPLSNRNVSNPSSGSYINGSYATFALPPMTSSSAQSSLNKCYTAVVGLSGSDYYFNATVRCLTLFVLTGNFWAPGASGVVFPPTVTKAETNGTGTRITLTTNKTLQTSSVTASTFTLYLNNVAQSNGISSVSISGETITLNIATAAIPQPGQTITLSYSGSGDIKSSEGATMEAFTKREVLNLLEGNETILDDCEDGNELNNVGGIWFTFNDQKDQEGACQSGSKSTVTPLTSSSNPFVMSSSGYNSDYAVKATYTLGTNYTPYDGGSCASWTNPAYIGIGTWVDKVETNTMDWTSGIGVKFWYKGPACAFQVIIEEVEDYCFHKKDIPASANWTEVTVLWSDLAQPTWGVQKTFSAKHVQKLQWQYEKGNSADNGTIWIDDVRILNMPPVPLTSMTIGVHPDSKVTDPLNLKIDETDTLELAITTQPTNASYPVVFWSSSDETVAEIDYLGRVFPKGYGETTITARSKMHQSITATYTVKVPAPSVPPTGISFSPTSYTIPVGTTDMLLPIFAPIGVTETDVTWSSSNSTIASVNATGVVTGVSVGGPVTITATSKTKTNVKGTATVMVVGVGVDEITVDKNPITMTIGESETVTATVLPANATNKSVAWSTTNSAIATVTNGVIASQGVGSCTIRVTSNDNSSKYVDIPVTVKPIAVTSVSVTPKTVSLVDKASTTLSATVLPSGAEQGVSWSSANTNIATVANGIVTATGVGSTTITVTSTSDNTKSDICVVTVTPKLVESITLNHTTRSLIINETATLTATVSPANATDPTYVWKSSNEAVATVNSSGVVTALAEGTANITATANDASGKVGICVVTVSPRLVTSISVLPATLSLVINESSNPLTATVSPANATDPTYVWQSSNTAVATVNSSGVVTALAQGTANITATANDASGKVGTCVVTVSPRLVTSISVLPTTLSLVINESSNPLTATVIPANATDPTYVWKSSNEAVATVNNSGVVTALAQGTANITATANDASGKVGTCVVTVSPRLVTNISVLPATLSLVIDEISNPLTATVIPATATDPTYEWASSNTAVATVDNSGVVTALAEGTANITATANDASGKVGTCVVTVTPIMPNSISIPAEIGFVIGDPAQQLTAVFDPVKTTNQAVTWESSDESIAKVVDGLVTAVGVGNCIITVRSVADNTKFDICAVTVDSDIVNVTGVSLNQNELTISIQASQALTATVNPLDATNKSVIWSSDNPAIAEVVNGTVTGISVGSTIIRVETVDGSHEATCIVNVKAIPVEGVSLNESSLSLAATSGPVQLVATINPANATNKAVNWSSSNEAVVTVNDMGIITVKGIGEAIITVTTVDGNYSATCNVEITAVDVTDIALNHSSLELTPASAPVTLEVTITPSDASDKTVVWSVTEPGVVSVTNGVVSVLGIGSTKVVATSHSNPLIADTCFVTVSPIPVEGVSLNESSLLLAATSGPVQLVATVNPENATNQAVNWSSSNETVVTVNNMGIITVQGIGEAIITVTTVDGNYSATCNIEVTAIDVTAITLNHSSLELTPASAPVTLEATITPSDASDKTVVWSVTEPGVVSVTNGVVTVLGIGSTKVVATSHSNPLIADTCFVTVSPIPVEGVSLNESSLLLAATSGPVQLVATINPTNATNQTVNWSSSNETVVTVNDMGIITVKGVGEAIITVTTVDGNYPATCNVEVTAVTTPVASVTVSPQSQTIQINESLTISATINPTNATNKSILWESSNNAIATVDANGVVTPITTGSVNIIATTVDGNFKDTCKLTITDILTTHIFISNSQNLVVGETVQISVENVLPAGASTDVTWASDNEAVATIDANGVITAISVGDANITAIATDGTLISSNECLVTVSKVDVTAVTVTPTTAILEVGGASLQLQASVQPSNATNKNVIWTGNAGLIASVDNSGMVTPLAKGTVVVTATSAERDIFKGTCTIQVVDKAELVATIADVQLVHNTAVTGTAVGQYPASAKTALQLAITTAQAVVSNTQATQEQIDAAIVDLLKAEQDFYKKQIVNETLIFNAELENLTYLNTYWYSYNDSEPGGSSSVTPLTDASSPFTMSQTGAQGTEHAAMIDYSLMGASVLGYSPFVGMGMAMNDPEAAYDLTGSTGMSFWVKSQHSYFLEINLESITDDCNYYVELPAALEWTEIRLSWSDFEQYSWGIKVPWDLTEIMNFQWKIQAADGIAGQLWIDEVRILGKLLDLPPLNIVDKSNLDAIIVQAQTLRNSAQIGNGDGQYPQSAATTFDAAISSALAIQADESVTQIDVDAAVIALQTAIEQFNSQRISVDKTALLASIQTAQNFHNVSTEGAAEGQYPIGSKANLQAAINTANNIYTNTLASQEQVNQAKIAVDEALLAFQNLVVGVNKGSLFVKIQEATTLHANSEEGTANGQFPVGSKANFYAAISSAQGVYDNTQTTQVQVNQAVSDLNSAIAAFEALRIYVEPLNKTLLASKINEAHNALGLATGNTGDNPGNYPVSAVNTFTSAISTAQSVYDNATTQNELNQQVITLQAAISAFLLSEIPVPIDKLALELNIAEADELIVYAETGSLPGQYPQTAWTVFYNAIQSARVVYNKPTATQEEVDAKNESLVAAIQAFKDAMIPVSIEAVSLVAKMYPNPVVSNVTIEAPSYMSEIIVMSVLGEIVRVEKVNATNVSIDMQNQANGIYLISISYKNGKTETVRITKQ
ncbi:MAG: CIA30 family protein [Bacteroidales bacterium]|nr:CIA30 family protein [Bacteroidales bacterium]